PRQDLVVAGVAPVLGDVEDQLAVAVVLGHGIAAAVVHAARDLAAVELEGRVPLQVLAHHLRPAHALQAFGDHRAIADPAARIGARARLPARAGARDQPAPQ